MCLRPCWSGDTGYSRLRLSRCSRGIDTVIAYHEYRATFAYMPYGLFGMISIKSSQSKPSSVPCDSLGISASCLFTLVRGPPIVHHMNDQDAGQKVPRPQKTKMVTQVAHKSAHTDLLARKRRYCMRRAWTPQGCTRPVRVTARYCGPRILLRVA